MEFIANHVTVITATVASLVDARLSIPVFAPRQLAKCLRTVPPYGRLLFPWMREWGGAVRQSLPSCRGGQVTTT